MLFDERGQADTYARKIEVAERAYRLLTEAGFPPEEIVFDPNVLAVATGIEAHDRYALDFIEATRWIKEHLPPRQGVGRRFEPLVRLPRQQRRARGDALGLPLPRHRGGNGHGHRQSPVVAGLQRHRTRTARTRRGRRPLPSCRRCRAAHRLRTASPHRHRGRRSRTRGGVAHPAAAGTHRIRSAQRSDRPHRDRHARSLPRTGRPDAGDRPAADACDGARGRTLRPGQDVPAAGRQVGARDETRRRGAHPPISNRMPPAEIRRAR